MKDSMNLMADDYENREKAARALAVKPTNR
jgi:hypothetical protein